MIPVLSREQMRQVDRFAIERCHVPSLVLMENAGRGAAELILRALGESAGEVVVVAGTGNNGGDGFVVARRLLGDGRVAEVLLVGAADALQGDARANHDAWRGLGGFVREIGDDAGVALLAERLDSLASQDVIVDALLGTGLDRPVEGRLRQVIDAINASAARCFALDVPSGLDASTGAVLGAAVRAETTITFGHLKLGLLSSVGAEHAGDVAVADIGVPATLSRHVGCSAWLLETKDVERELVARSVATHKGSAGHVVVIAGSPGKTGAALLVARGALRAGAGLATVAAFPAVADPLDARVLEEMTVRLDAERLEASLDDALGRADVVAIGPGLGTGPEARRVVDHVVLRWPGTKVVDADALTAFAGRAGELSRAVGRLLLTPHPGELGRLLGRSATEIEADRFGALAQAVELTNAVVLLKGPRTLIGAPGELPVVNPSGTPALATAGSGDVLTGIVAALALGLAPRVAALAGAHLHGLAAESWSASTGSDRGLLAREIADRIPETLARLAAPPPRMPD